MKYPDFLELTTLVDDDILLVHQASTMALKKIKLSTLKQYIGSVAASASASIETEILKDKPIGYWKLEETTGTIAANLGSGMSSGTYNNVLLNQSSLAQGSTNSVSFNGTNSSINFTNTLLNANADISLECLVKLSSTSLKGSFIKLGNNGVGIGIGLGGGTHDDLGNNLIGIAEGIAWKPTNIKIGIGTHHIGLAFKGNTTKEWLFYLDGFLVATLSGQTIFAPNNIGFIGTGDNARFVNSIIDEVAIYNKVLPPIRWLAHANTVIY